MKISDWKLGIIAVCCISGCRLSPPVSSDDSVAVASTARDDSEVVTGQHRQWLRSWLGSNIEPVSVKIVRGTTLPPRVPWLSEQVADSPVLLAEYPAWTCQTMSGERVGPLDLHVAVHAETGELFYAATSAPRDPEIWPFPKAEFATSQLQSNSGERWIRFLTPSTDLAMPSVESVIEALSQSGYLTPDAKQLIFFRVVVARELSKDSAPRDYWMVFPRGLPVSDERIDMHRRRGPYVPNRPPLKPLLPSERLQYVNTLNHMRFAIPIDRGRVAWGGTGLYASQFDDNQKLELERVDPWP
jgi:hypothetical protein